MIKYLLLFALCAGCSTIEKPYHKKTIYNLDGTVNTTEEFSAERSTGVKLKP